MTLTKSLPIEGLGARILRRLGREASSVRVADARERETLLAGDEGFVLVEGGAIVGHVAYNVTERGFYGHSLLNWGGASGAARLIQRVRATARSRGFDACHFHVAAPTLDLMRLVGKNVAVESAILRLEVR